MQLNQEMLFYNGIESLLVNKNSSQEFPLILQNTFIHFIYARNSTCLKTRTVIINKNSETIDKRYTVFYRRPN